MKKLLVLSFLVSALCQGAYLTQLPPNAATETTLSTLNGKVPTNGQKTSSGSVPVVISSDQSAVTVTGTVTTTPPANATVDVTKVNGTTVDTNSGSKSAGTIRVVIATDQPQVTAATKVDGSATTQPVSASSLPLPTGAATVAKQPALGTAGTPASDVLTVQGAASMTALKVDGSATTQPISGTVTVTDGSGALNVIVDSSALPSGAATAAKQPALGTAGTASADVITVQGKSGMTAVAVDGSGVTQPVSGSVTVAGSVAHDGVGTGVSPLLTGGYASAAAPSDVSADGDAVRGWHLRNGAVVIQPTYAGVLQSTGNGAAGTGTPRVTIASDNSAIPISGTVTVTDGAGALNVIVDSSALPAGASTASKQPALGTAGAASADVISIQGVASMTAVKTDGSATTQPISGTVTANVGTTNGLALDATLTGGTQQTKLTDGTNVATVKAASTAAVGADKALVVAISPNNTVPVSLASTTITGTVTVSDGAGALNVIVDSSALPSGAATSAKQPALGTAGSSSADVLSIQGVASMTPLQENLTQIAGTSVDTNSGSKSAGTLRVVIATDQPANTNALNVNIASGSATSSTLSEGTRAPADIATPEAIAASTTLVQSVIIRAGRTARVANTSSVWIGKTSTNDSQLIELIPGNTITLTAPPGENIDLNLIYVDSVTLTDGVVWMALK